MTAEPLHQREEGLPCACCTEHAVDRKSDGTWRCRACGAAGVTLTDGAVERFAVTRRPLAVPTNASTHRAGVGHLSPRERLELGLLRDGNGAKLDTDELERRARARRQGDAVSKATQRLARAAKR